MLTSNTEKRTTAVEKPLLLGADAVDMTVLIGLEEAQVEGEPDLVVELMELYLADAEKKLAAMHVGLAEKDARSIRRLAHSLRGSSASLGAGRMATLCAGLERAGEDDLFPGAGTSLVALELELARVRRAFGAARRERTEGRRISARLPHQRRTPRSS